MNPDSVEAQVDTLINEGCPNIDPETEIIDAAE